MVREGGEMGERGEDPGKFTVSAESALDTHVAFVGRRDIGRRRRKG